MPKINRKTNLFDVRFASFQKCIIQFLCDVSKLLAVENVPLHPEKISNNTKTVQKDKI